MPFAAIVETVKKSLGYGVEQKSIGLTDTAAFELFGAVPTASGVNITATSALNIPAVLQAVRLISENVGSVPCKLYRETDDSKEAAKDHPAYKIVHGRANDWTSAGRLRIDLTIDALVHGGGYAQVVRLSDDQPFELHRLDPQKVLRRFEDDGQPSYLVSTPRGMVPLSYRDVLHIPGFADTSLVKFGREAIGVAALLERYTAQFFSTGGRPSIIIKVGKAADNDAGANKIKNIRNDFKRWKADPNEPLILPPESDIEQPTMTSSDGQFIETAVVAAWRHADGRITVHPWFFVPGEDLNGRAQRDGVPYEQWRDDGKIIVIDGPVIEPGAVEQRIREICADNDNVQEIAFDPHLARMTMQRLHDDGFPAIEMRQGPLTMGPAIGDLERTVNGRMIRHDGHPVLRHHFDSVVSSRNDTGLIRMHKGKKTDRIDGAVAAAMAVSRAVANDNRRSVLDMDPDEYDRIWSEAA